MKKLLSLIRACMTSDMSLFKLKKKKNSKFSTYLPLLIGGYLMFMIWCYANSIFEQLAPTHVQYVVLSLFAFAVSIFTFMEGIYKSSSLLFNCKDDDLLLSLPITRKTILFVRLLKFYVFELMFNSLFLFPVMVAYIRWAEHLTWTYYLSSIMMLLLLPIIPIVLSCIVSIISSFLSSKMKHKNATQIVISMIFIIGIMGMSFYSQNMMSYLISHATSLNDFIMKIYYPAGVYAKLVSDFQILDLILFIAMNLFLFILFIYVFSMFYFKLNSNLKRVTTHSTRKTGKLVIKRKSKVLSLIRKELNMFFTIPVFIINSGFSLVLYMIAIIGILFKFDSIIGILTSTEQGFGLSKDLIFNNISIFIFLLLSVTAYMTSITNSLISLEGRNINILKTLPVSVKTILMSKIYACMVITTPVLILGELLLFVKFKLSFIEMILLLFLGILIPLVSHFIGIIINLQYPKLDFENESEVVKQSMSSFLSVMIGMILFIVSIVITLNLLGNIHAKLLLFLTVVFYLIVDFILYQIMLHKGVKDFNKLSV